MGLQEQRFYTEEEYEKIDHDGLVEYDNGRIILMSPPSTLHQEVSFSLGRLIGNYLSGKKCKVYLAPFNVRLNLGNNIKRVEPDISVICDRAKITAKGCEGSPDFIIEVVSPNNKAHDYFTKLNWYSQAGVKEYWIVDPLVNRIMAYQFNPLHLEEYTFNDIVPVSIWDGNFAIDFKEIEFTNLL